MTDPFLAEIRTFAGNYAPQGWALCNGQLMPISQNTALFSLLGVTYGGDGRSTFALPNLNGAAPVQQGQGPALSPRYLGEEGGERDVTLLNTEMPSHTHAVSASTSGSGNVASPAAAVWAQPQNGRVQQPIYTKSAANQVMAGSGVGTTGGSQPHNNMPPYLVVSYIIALQGIFPQRP